MATAARTAPVAVSKEASTESPAVSMTRPPCASMCLRNTARAASSVASATRSSSRHHARIARCIGSQDRRQPVARFGLAHWPRLLAKRNLLPPRVPRRRATSNRVVDIPAILDRIRFRCLRAASRQRPPPSPGVHDGPLLGEPLKGQVPGKSIAGGKEQGSARYLGRNAGIAKFTTIHADWRLDSRRRLWRGAQRSGASTVHERSRWCLATPSRPRPARPSGRHSRSVPRSARRCRTLPP